MNRLIKYGLWLFLVALVVGNITIFMNGIQLSDEINYYESQITELKKDNRDLEKKTYEMASLNYAASVSAQLNFVKKSSPVYLESLKYARSN